LKKVFFIFFFIFQTLAFANEELNLSPVNFQINAEDALVKFEQILLNPENFLLRFRPVGAQISNKKVSQNVISFIATKKILFISKSVYVNGILDNSTDKVSCENNDLGYSLNMRFDSSDHLVTDNVEELQARICVHPISNSKFKATVLPKIILGNHYSKPLGPFAVNLIKDQIAPLLKALSEEISAQH
jgi:hypothetical protein